MTKTVSPDMEREYRAQLTKQICDALNLDLEYMASQTARDVAAGFGAPELADDLKATMCPAY